MDIHVILQIIGDCLMAIGVCLGGHHTFTNYKKNKSFSLPRKEKKKIKLQEKLNKLKEGNE